MSTHMIDMVRMTPDGDLTLPETVKARLWRLLERQPGDDAFSVYYEEEGALVLVPVREGEEPAYVPTERNRRGGGLLPGQNASTGDGSPLAG